MRSWQARPAWQVPVQWPDGATASERGYVFRARLFKAAMLIAMLALTVLDRFGLSVTAQNSLPVGMLAMYFVAGVMVLGGAAELNFRAALAYLAVVGVATLSLLVNGALAPPPYVSKPSFLLLILLYAPLCVSLRQGAVAPESWRWTVNLYIAFALLVAVAGITQFFMQFVFRPAWLFDYAPLIPEALRAPGTWNTEYTVSEGLPGAWTKSNGFFMREPSFFSVVMAFGLVCELGMARRKWVMSVFGLGLVLSYSGAGLLCLAVALLFPLGRGTAVRVLAFAVFAAALLVLFGDALNLSYTLNRSDELLNRSSSGYCRIVGPAVEVAREMAAEPWTSLVGNGPGSMRRMGNSCIGVHQTTYAKALFEYGVLGTLALGILMLGALNRSSAPIRIRVAAGLVWALFGGNLLDPLHLLFIYIVSAMWPSHAARDALKSAAPARVPRRRAFRRGREPYISASARPPAPRLSPWR